MSGIKKSNSSNSTGKDVEQEEYIDIDDLDLRSQTQVLQNDINKMQDQMENRIKELQQDMTGDNDQGFIDIGRLTLSSAICKRSQMKEGSQKLIKISQAELQPVSHQAGKYMHSQMPMPTHEANNVACQQIDSPCSIRKTPNMSNKIKMKVDFTAPSEVSDLESNYFRLKNGTQNVIRRTTMLKPMNGANIVHERSKSKSNRPLTSSTIYRKTLV